MAILRGYDISAYQTVRSFADMRKSVRFCIVKATEGTSYVSSTFERYYRGSKSAQLLTGSYHFARPDSNPTLSGARKEAANYVRRLKEAGFQSGRDLPPCLDLERGASSLSKKALTDWSLAFMNEVDKLLGLSGAYRCGIYANPNYLDNETDGDKLTSGRWVWLARWPSAYSRTWPTAVDKRADIWQFTEEMTQAGTTGRGDANIAEESTLRRLAPLYFGGGSVSTPPPSKPKGASRDLKGALAYAESQRKNPTQSWYQLCLAFVRSCWGFQPSGIPDAHAGWDRSKDRHSDRKPPAGAPVYWRGGKWGHVALSAGGGYVYSNDIRRKGKIDKVPLSEIERKWGMQYRGWTGDYCGTPLHLDEKPKTNPTPAPPPKEGDDDMPIFRHLAVSEPVKLERNTWVSVKFSKEYHDGPEDTHAEGGYSYRRPTAGYSDHNLRGWCIEGMNPGDEFQIRLTLKDISDWSYTRVWSCIVADGRATNGKQFGNVGALTLRSTHDQAVQWEVIYFGDATNVRMTRGEWLIKEFR